MYFLRAASALEAGGPGSALGEGLRLTNTAWALGMSEAMTACAEGVSAVSLNPAGVLDSQVTTVHLTHAFHVEGLTEDYVAYTQRMPPPLRSAVGASLHGIYDGSTVRTVEDSGGNYGGEIGTYAMGFAVGGVAYALDLSPLVPEFKALEPRAGAGLRGVWQRVDDKSWLGLSLDLGAKLRAGRHFSFGCVLQNAGVMSGSAHLPLQWVMGMAWQGEGLGHRHDRLLVEMDFPLAVDRTPSLRFGGEYRVGFGRIALAARAGWKDEVEVPGSPGISTGLGFRWMLGVTPWGVDYAYVPWGIFGSLHAISVTVGLAKREREGPPPAKVAPQELRGVFYPGRGESVVFTVTAEEPAVVSASLLDYRGEFLMTVLPETRVPPGPYRIVWDMRLPDGTMAEFERLYRMRIQLGNRTWYENVVLRED